jgi:hypothetical protein
MKLIQIIENIKIFGLILTFLLFNVRTCGLVLIYNLEFSGLSPMIATDDLLRVEY